MFNKKTPIRSFLFVIFNLFHYCICFFLLYIQHKLHQRKPKSWSKLCIPAQPVKIPVSILCIIDTKALRLTYGIPMLHFPCGSKSLSARTIHFSLPCPFRCQGSTNILSGICSCPWTNGSWETSVYPVFFKNLSFIPIPFLAITNAAPLWIFSFIWLQNFCSAVLLVYAGFTFINSIFLLNVMFSRICAYLE